MIKAVDAAVTAVKIIRQDAAVKTYFTMTK